MSLSFWILLPIVAGAKTNRIAFFLDRIALSQSARYHQYLFLASPPASAIKPQMGMDNYNQRHQIIAAPTAAGITHRRRHHQTVEAEVGEGGSLPVVSNHSASSSSEEDGMMHRSKMNIDNNIDSSDCSSSSSGTGRLPLGHYQSHRRQRPDHDVDHDRGVGGGIANNNDSYSYTKKQIAVDTTTAPTLKQTLNNVPLARPPASSFASIARQQETADSNNNKNNGTHSPTNIGSNGGDTGFSASQSYVAIPRQHDPHNIYERFVRNHLTMFNTAYTEIRQGQKRTHWVWFIFPTSPYIVNGIERGSQMNRHFALRSDDAVKAYLNYKHPNTTPQQQDSNGTGAANGDGNVAAAAATDGTTNGSNDQTYYYLLRHNYINILSALVNQLQCGNSLEVVFGEMDYSKVLSSIKLFRRVGMECILHSDLEKNFQNRSGNDSSSDARNGSSYRELVMLCNKVLELALPNKTQSDCDADVANTRSNKMKRDSNHSDDSLNSIGSGSRSGGKTKSKKKRNIFRRW